MVKAKLFDKSGKEKGTVELPNNFNSAVRTDVLLKVFESQKLIDSQSYGMMYGAGAWYSASGISKKRRNVWKNTYGKGISRTPRKIMSRSGSSFNWIGATAPNTRGGRSAHGPTSDKNLFRKINKKELKLAFNSALSSSVNPKFIESKYGVKGETGLVFDNKILETKTKEFVETMQKVFGSNFEKIFKVKTVRAGVGKSRGRKYKSNAGLLFVIANEEKMSRSGITVVKVKDLKVSDLTPNGIPGRFICYTENAIKQIGERFK